MRGADVSSIEWGWGGGRLKLHGGAVRRCVTLYDALPVGRRGAGWRWQVGRGWALPSQIQIDIQREAGVRRGLYCAARAVLARGAGLGWHSLAWRCGLAV